MIPILLSTESPRILIIKPSAVGDVVHALPALARLRARFPRAYLAWLVTPACAGLLDGHPLLDAVIRFDRRYYGTGWRDPASLAGLLKFARGLRRENFDVVLDFQGLFRSGWLARQTRAAVRVGFAAARELAPHFYTHRIDVGSPEQHAVDRYLKVVAALGCADGPVAFPFGVTDVDRSDVASLVPGSEPYAVLLPGTNWATKRWPVESFARLPARLRDRLGLASVVAGAPGDAPLAARIATGARAPGDVVDLTGRTSLNGLVALVERASLVIANDSGPMHIAAALGRPLVTLFGPTNPVRTGPYGRPESVLRLDVPCSPCYSRRCGHQSCLRWLTVDHVVAQAERAVGRADRRA